MYMNGRGVYIFCSPLQDTRTLWRLEERRASEQSDLDRIGWFDGLE